MVTSDVDVIDMVWWIVQGQIGSPKQRCHFKSKEPHPNPPHGLVLVPALLSLSLSDRQREKEERGKRPVSSLFSDALKFRGSGPPWSDLSLGFFFSDTVQSQASSFHLTTGAGAISLTAFTEQLMTRGPVAITLPCPAPASLFCFFLNRT